MKTILRYIKKLFGGLVLFLIMYLAAVFLLPKFAVNDPPTLGRDIVIYLQTNGVHTDLILPAKSVWKDWTSDFSYQNTKKNDTSLSYVSVGWGDKGFYLETPTWAELKASTAIKAAFGLSGSAVHATYLRSVKPSATCQALSLSQDQYLALVEFINCSLDKNTDQTTKVIATTGLYGLNDAFYEANGRYSIFYSCNTWTNDALKSCGQKACLWTVLQDGIFRHYQNSESI